MHGCEDHFSGLEREVRSAFRTLVRDALPAAARARGWSITEPDAFAGLLLDHVLGAPWEATLASAEAAGVIEVMLAVETGGRMLEGGLRLGELQRRSAALRLTPACAARHDHCDRAVEDLLRSARRPAAPHSRT